MKLTNKQKQEIEFFSQVWPDIPFTPTEEDIQEYIDNTVHGSKPSVDARGIPLSKLIISKRELDITIPMWKEDLVCLPEYGFKPYRLLAPQELRDEKWYQHPYGKKVIDSVIGILK